jgi:hypothetical protein
MYANRKMRRSNYIQGIKKKKLYRVYINSPNTYIAAATYKYVITTHRWRRRWRGGGGLAAAK